MNKRARLIRLGGALVLLAMAANGVSAQTFTTLCTFNGANGTFPEAVMTVSGSTLYGTRR
jgi:hypothetical protein